MSTIKLAGSAFDKCCNMFPFECDLCISNSCRGDISFHGVLKIDGKCYDIKGTAEPCGDKFVVIGKVFLEVCECHCKCCDCCHCRPKKKECCAFSGKVSLTPLDCCCLPLVMSGPIEFCCVEPSILCKIREFVASVSFNHC